MPTAAAASAQVDPLAQSVRALISGRAAGAGAGACVDVTAMHQYGQRELLLYATKNALQRDELCEAHSGINE